MCRSNQPTGLPCVGCEKEPLCGDIVCDPMWAWAYHALTGKEYMHGRFKKTCGVCGRAFYPVNRWSKYCSDECRKEKIKDYSQTAYQKKKRRARKIGRRA